MTLGRDIPPTDHEDIRLAVVMNGGVSLAIWIGGVTQEINRLTQAKPDDGSAYGALLDLLSATARVDVIAGTSAGGINGAFLALAQAYGEDLGGLGELWADQGGLLDLLRPAREADPPSLMRGDGYFLPALRAAFESVAPPGLAGAPADPDDVPIDLSITTSLMNGRLTSVTDDFGNEIVEIEHKGLFEFRRGNDHADAFADAAAVTAQLALAARSTASFPIAFEPSYVPVGPDGTDRLHPDMTGVANFPASRYVLDGGVLLNKPVAPALKAIFAQPAERQVRRVLAYVVPDPGDPTVPEPDKAGTGPGAGRVLVDALVSLPRAQTITQQLEEIRQHNRRAQDEQVARPELIPQVGESVRGIAEELFPTYQLIRARRAVRAIADTVGPLTAPPRGSAAGPPAWTRNELLAAFRCEGPALAEALPFVPSKLRVVADAGEWDWGLAPSERLTRLAIDAFRRAMLVAPWNEPELRILLHGHRKAVHGAKKRLMARRAADTTFWRAQAALLGPPPANTAERRDRLAAWVAAARTEWPLAGPDAAARTAARAEIHAATQEVLDVLVRAEPDLRAAVELGRASRDVDDYEVAALDALLDGLGLGRPTTKRRSRPTTVKRTVLQRVFATEVVLVALGCAPEPVPPVDLVQVSGETPNGFGGPVGVAAKLAGVQLGHFGAFYKRSWRVSDWTWGRVDGATRLTQILLSPARLRQLGLTRADVVPAIRTIATGGPGGDSLAPAFERDLDRIEAELAFLDTPDDPLPPSLPVTAMAVARRIQGELLAGSKDVKGELEALADAVDYDIKQGGTPGAGALFEEKYRTAAGGVRLTPGAALTLFADADIASETVLGEAGSDLFAMTASRAAMVSVSAADAKGTGLGPARAITHALRGVVLLAYALVYGATRRSRIGTAFVNVVLATGGALLAVSLLSEKVPGVARAGATVVVVAALAVAALRSRLWELAIVLAVPATAVVALLYARDGWAVVADNGTTIAAVAGIVLAFVLLGALPGPSGPPPFARRPVPWYLAAAVVTFASYFWLSATGVERILDLEFAFTADRARPVLDSWAKMEGGFGPARAFLWRDYAFLAGYGVLFSACAGLAATAYREAGATRWYRAGGVLAWLALVAAAFDAIENVFQLLMVTTDQPLDVLVPLSSTAVVWKFALLGLVGAYVLGAAVPLARLAWAKRPSPRP